MSTSRPLSPHLQIYRPQLTAVLSITHRATGLVLCAGALILVYWLVALASGPAAYARATSVLGSLPGLVVLLGVTFCFFYHLCNGVRHLCWDFGRGLEIEQVYASGRLVVAAAIVLTALAWIAAFAAGG